MATSTYRLAELPFDYSALEPHISGRIMELEIRDPGKEIWRRRVVITAGQEHPVTPQSLDAGPRDTMEGAMAGCGFQHHVDQPSFFLLPLLK